MRIPYQERFSLEEHGTARWQGFGILWRVPKRLLMSLIGVGGLLLVTSFAGNPELPAPIETPRGAAALHPVIPAQYRGLVAMTRKATLPEEEGAAARLHNAQLAFSSDRIVPVRPFIIAGGADNHARALHCLTQAVYYEAGFEPVEGRRAVAQVVLNRMRHPAFAKSVCGVVYEGYSRLGCQFSFTCDGALARAPAPAAWAEAGRIAAAALAGHVEVIVGTATHYHADYVFPRWAPRLGKVAQIGTHIFYRWPGGWGEPRAFAAAYVGHETIPVVDLTAIRLRRQEGDAMLPAAAVLPERHAENDVGGRIDPTKGWKLSISLPSGQGAALKAIANSQVETPPVRVAAAVNGATIP